MKKICDIKNDIDKVNKLIESSQCFKINKMKKN